MKRRLLHCAFAALVLPAIFGASTAVAAVKSEGLTPLHGSAVQPRVVRFDALPRITTPYTGPIIERPEAINPEAEAELEYLKEHPADIRPEQLTQFTLDTNSGGNQVLAPTVGNGFEGITQGAYIPGEPAVAAGPLNIFTTGNVSVTVTNKDGSNRVETNGQAFFGIVGESPISDPQCYYDAVHGRFVALAFTQGTSPTNYSSYYLAISQTNDARGAWYTYKFDMTKDGNTPSSNWGDYQALGVSEDKIAFSSQQFRFADNNFAYQKIRIIDRALAYSGAPVTYVDFIAFNAPSGQIQDVFVTKVARDLTPGDNTIHCLCIRTNGGSNVTYRTVTGPPSAPVLSAGNIVNCNNYSAPPDGVQKGSTTGVPTNDCRPTDFYVRNGVLIVAWHTAASVGGGTVCAIRLLRLRTSDQTVLTDETYGAPATFMYYPAVTVDSVGTIFLGFDRSSATEYPSAYATGKRRGDVGLQPSALLKSGVAPNAQPRWGDFTGIDNDASLSGPGGATAWYAGQFTKSSFTFGAWINRLSFTYGQAAGTVTDDSDGSLGTTGDRGPAAGVTLSLLQGAATVSTTQTDAAGNFNFGYLEAGTYDIVVTPPDGGSALDAVAGTGGNAQTRISASDVQIDLTNSQTSVANNFFVTSLHPVPVTTSISPSSRTVGSGAFTLTVNGANFVRASTVQLDGGGRATTYVSASRLTAAIPGSDVASPAIHTITVVSPGPGGGTSNPQTLTVPTGTDHTAPVVTVSSPAGGESWPVASLHNITWSATDDVVVANVDLDYSTNGGASFPFAIAHAIPNAGSYAWTVAGTPSTTVRVRVTARDADGNVAADSSHANFTISGWTITASAGANGSISPVGAVGVPDGGTPSFTMTPSIGYSVANVLVNGGSVGAVTNYTFAAVHANQTIAVTFSINQYSLNVAIVGSGSVAKAPDQALYDYGTPVTLTANASSGSSFQAWSGDATGSANPLIVTMTGNRNVTATFYQHIYTWVGTGTASFATPASWSPPRTAPAADDVLLFNGGGAVTANQVATQTIASLSVSNSTSVTLQSLSFATLTFAGGAGTDLTVGAGSALRLTGGSAIVMALPATSTASIAGTMDILGGPHRFQALGTNAIEFLAGSALTMGTGFSGNLFGTGTSGSALNSVVFHNGSLCAQSAGATPFGATAPNSVVTFEHGSRFRLDAAAITPQFAGRTYGDFEQNNTSSITPTGGSAFTLDSLIVTRGGLNLNVNPGGTIRGSIVVKSGTTLQLNPLSASTFTLGGGTTQRIDIQGNFSTTSFANVTVNNPSGIQLASNISLNGGLTFVTGRVMTGSNVLAVTGGAITGASQAAGYVDGNLRLTFAAGALSSRTFDVGDEASYTPVTVDIADLASASDMTATVHPSEHPNIASSGLEAARSVNRYWTLSVPSAPSYSSFAATFQYRSNNMDATAEPSLFQVKRWNGAWFSTAVGTRTATSTQATALSDFGDFIVADPPLYSLIVGTTGSGSVAKSPDQVAYAPNSNVQLTATPGPGWIFTGWSGNLTGNTNPVNVTMNGNKTITAAFADTTIPTIALITPNGLESLPAGSTANVTWTAGGTQPLSGIDILLSRTGSAGPFDPVALSVPNTGSYGWIVGGPAASAAMIQVVAHMGAATAADRSDTTFTITTPVNGADVGPVTEFALSPVLPNPAHNGALMRFALPKAAKVRLSVDDLQGREIEVVASGELPAGRHEARLATGRDGLRPGLYFAHLQVEGKTLVRRFVVTW